MKMNKSWFPLLILLVGLFAGCQQKSPAEQVLADRPKDNTKVHWMTWEEVQLAQQIEPRKVFVDVYTEWCGPCKLLNKNTFTNPVIIATLNEQFYPVKFNAQHEGPIDFKGQMLENPDYDPVKGQKRRNGVHQLARGMQVRAYPTLVFMDENLDMIQGVSGYKTPQQLEPMLAYLGSNAQNETPYNQWLGSFQSQL